MILKGKRHLGNEGSAFVVVLICMLFIGIIAAIVLGLSHGNLKNLGTGMKSSENFYEAEEALDELRDGLKRIAHNAVQKAYEDYLQTYSVNAIGETMDEAQLKKKFNELFANNIKNELKTYFREGSSSGAAPLKNYKELMYKYNISAITTEDEESLSGGTTKTPAYFVIDDVNKVVSIKNIKITYRDSNGHLSTISTDLSFDVTIPSITVGTNVGLSTSTADFAIITDQTVKCVDGSTSLVMGNIYGGGKNNKNKKDEEGNDLYDQPGILIQNRNIRPKNESETEEDYNKYKEGVPGTRLYSDLIITRSTIETLDQAKLEIFGKNELKQIGVTNDYYAKIWANNILMDNTGDNTVAKASNINIQGECYVADDLTINTDGSKFKLEGIGSKYYAYSTNMGITEDDKNMAGTSSSIVVNGSGVDLDLKSASMLWLAGKSYVEVPSIWGYKDGVEKAPSKTFQLGETISYRALQAAYMLPGECIMGVGHNPMNVEEYLKLIRLDADVTTDASKKQALVDFLNDPENDETEKVAKLNSLLLTKPSIEISQSYLHEKMDLTKYIDTENPCSVEFVRYKGDRLAYVYINFISPAKAAEYFRDYYTQYKSLVDGRMKKLGKTGKLQFNINNVTVDATHGTYTLPDATLPENTNTPVQTTGNLVYYDGEQMKLITPNLTDKAARNKQKTLKDQYKNLYTTLNSSISMLDNQPLTENITAMNNITTSKVEKIEKEEGDSPHDQYEFKLSGVNTVFGNEDVPRLAFMITSTGNVVVGKGYVKLDVNDDGNGGVLWGHGADPEKVSITENIEAGIIIAKGKVTVENGADFWGTIIAQKDITLEGGAQVYAASADVRKLIQVNSIVIPYFSRDKDPNGGNKGASSWDFVDVVYDNWRKD